VLGGIVIFGFLFSELVGASGFGDIAHSAHLGGFAAGWLFFRHIYQREWKSPDRAPAIELPGWMQRTKKRPVEATAYKVNIGATPTALSKSELNAEVDRILDKINSHGFGALTDEEKRQLDMAKDLLNKR
jgi:hypothetical protein